MGNGGGGGGYSHSHVQAQLNAQRQAMIAEQNRKNAENQRRIQEL